MKYPPSFFPLQKGPDCVIESFLTAYQLAMSVHQPYLLENRDELVRKYGGPSDTRVVAGLLNARQSNVTFVPVDHSTAPNRYTYPLIVVTWRDRFTHCVVHVNGQDEYDPGMGAVVPQRGMADSRISHYAQLNIEPPAKYRWYQKVWYHFFGQPTHKL